MARGKNRGRGGKRTPREPAATSGVGAGSRRTDGGPGAAVANPASNPRVQPVRAIPSEDREFGSRQESVDLQRAAPLPAGGTPGAQPQAAAGASPDRLRSLAERIFADSERPDEPLNAGAAPFALPDPDAEQHADLQLLARQLPWLEHLAGLPTTSASARNFVRRVRASIPIETLLAGPGPFPEEP